MRNFAKSSNIYLSQNLRFTSLVHLLANVFPIIIKLNLHFQSLTADYKDFLSDGLFEIFFFSQDTVTWSRSDGRDLNERARVSYDGNMTFTLTIRGVKKEDRGEFICRANNHLVPGRNNTKAAVLKVNCKSESGQKVCSFKFFSSST